MKIRVVTATRLELRDFQAKSLLGISLARFQGHPVLGEVTVFSDNRAPLGELYNRVLDEEFAKPLETRQRVWFVHDDVLLEDLFCLEKLDRALERLDVCGIAGAAALSLDEDPCRWCQERFSAHLSGYVWHGPLPRPLLWGPPREVLVLDGVFLAVDTARERLRSVRFDPGLGFHFYDLDFCLRAHQAGAHLGTERVHLVHGSEGSYGSEAFLRSQARFKAVWRRPGGDSVLKLPSVRA